MESLWLSLYWTGPIGVGVFFYGARCSFLGNQSGSEKEIIPTNGVSSGLILSGRIDAMDLTARDIFVPFLSDLKLQDLLPERLICQRQAGLTGRHLIDCRD